VHGADDRQSSDELGNQAKLGEVLGHDVRIHVLTLLELDGLQLLAEAERVLADPALDDLVEASEGTTADEQHIGGVNRQEFLVRMLASTLWRHARGSSFQNLEQGLLHALA